MNILPEDILIQILSRLPVRSLIRLKCVSKKLYALIKSPHFIEMHMTLQVTRFDEHIRILQHIHCRHPHPYSVVTCFDDIESLRHLTTPLDIELPGYDKVFDFPDFVGHANGIVCISNHDSKITLWNPALREFRMLPSRLSCCLSGFYSRLFGVGFGFDRVTNDYKVVCLETILLENVSLNDRSLENRKMTVDVVQVYNLKTNSWKRLETRPQLVHEYVRNVRSQIFFQGCVHWCVWGMNLRVILTFNITTELFEEVECPRGCKEYDYNLSTSRLLILDKSTLSLVVVFKLHRADTFHVDIWVMNDNHVKNSWTKLYSIGPESYIIRILSFWKKEKLLFLTRDGVVIYYDLLTGEEHNLQAYDSIISYPASLIEALTCNETLFSIK